LPVREIHLEHAPWNPNIESTAQPENWTRFLPTNCSSRCALCLSHRGRLFQCVSNRNHFILSHWCWCVPRIYQH